MFSTNIQQGSTKSLMFILLCRRHCVKILHLLFHLISKWLHRVITQSHFTDKEAKACRAEALWMAQTDTVAEIKIQHHHTSHSNTATRWSLVSMDTGQWFGFSHHYDDKWLSSILILQYWCDDWIIQSQDFQLYFIPLEIPRSCRTARKEDILPLKKEK